MAGSLFTTDYLGSYVGLVAATYLLVQFFKDPIKQKLNDWWVRLLAVGIAFVIQLFTLYSTGSFTLNGIGLAFFNSFLIAISAAGAHNISQPVNPSLPTLADNLTVPVIAVPQVQDVNPSIITSQPMATDTSKTVNATL